MNSNAESFYVLLGYRVLYLVLGLPWLDDKQASLQFGTTRVFAMMNDAPVDT
jgi:hypothetical protein